MQCFCHLNYYLCGTELWCRKIPPHAKKCPRLYGDVIHFSVYCKRSTYPVRKSDLPFVYNRSGGCRHWGAYDPFPDSVLCHLCCDRNSFRSAARCRKSTGSYDLDLWRSLSFTYHLVVCLCKISSGDRKYHAQLSGVLDNYCGAVCHLLFSAISRYAEKEITIYEKVLILCNSSDQHLCFVRKMSIYYV